MALIRLAMPAEESSRSSFLYRQFLESAHSSVKHQLTNDADKADIVLFSDGGQEPYFRSIIGSSLFREFREKCFVSTQKTIRCRFSREFTLRSKSVGTDPRWERPGFYVSTGQQFDEQPWLGESRCLFSFVGSCCNAAVRKQLLSLHHPRFDLLDTSGKIVPAYTSGDQAAIADLNRRYADSVRRSSFVLCPRGAGCSSLRLFEVMRMGRSPVILSDEWAQPIGPQWDKFAVIVSEKQVFELPRMLSSREEFAEVMGRLARQEWEKWFSMQTFFDTTVDGCLDIQRAGKCGDSWFRRRKYFQLLRPFHARHYLRSCVRAA